MKLRDEAKRLKSLQKGCGRRTQELRGDGREVRIWNSAGSSVCAPGAWGPAPLGAGAKSFHCSPHERWFLQQQQEELNAALQRVIQEHKKKMMSIDWEYSTRIHSLRRGGLGQKEEDGGFLGRGAGVPGSGDGAVVSPISPRVGGVEHGARAPAGEVPALQAAGEGAARSAEAAAPQAPREGEVGAAPPAPCGSHPSLGSPSGPFPRRWRG